MQDAADGLGSTHVHEARLPADWRLHNLRGGVTANGLSLALLTPGAGDWVLVVVPDLLLDFIQSVTDKETLMCEVGQLGLPLQKRRAVCLRLPHLRL